MIEITKASEYSLRAAIALVDFYETNQTATVSEIANSESIPESFLRKLLKPLIRAEIIRSERGYSGGITLAKPPDEISVLDIIEAVDGKLSLNNCVLQPSECSLSSTCTIHGLWVDTTNLLSDYLKKFTLDDIQNKYLKSPGSTSFSMAD